MADQPNDQADQDDVEELDDIGVMYRDPESLEGFQDLRKVLAHTERKSAADVVLNAPDPSLLGYYGWGDAGPLTGGTGLE